MIVRILLFIAAFLLSASPVFGQGLTESEEAELGFYALMCLDRSVESKDGRVGFWQSEKSSLSPATLQASELLLSSVSESLVQIDDALLAQRCDEYHSGATGAPVHIPSGQLVSLDVKVRTQIDRVFGRLFGMGYSAQDTQLISNYFIYVSNNVVSREEVGARMVLFLSNVEAELDSLEAEVGRYTSPPVGKLSKEQRKQEKIYKKWRDSMLGISERQLRQCQSSGYYRMNTLQHDPDAHKLLIRKPNDVYDLVGKAVWNVLKREAPVLARRTMGGQAYELDGDLIAAIEKARRFERLSGADNLALLAFDSSSCRRGSLAEVRDNFGLGHGSKWMSYVELQDQDIVQMSGNK